MSAIQQLIRFITLILLLTTITYATDYYVDKNASGQNNGTSWTDAWESFSAINWGSVNPGDVIFVSGGTESAVYYETLALNDLHGTAAQHITIRNSYDTGHNGRVIIDGQYTRGSGISIGGSASDVCSYIYIKGFEVRNHAQYGECAVGGRWQNNVITIDSCLIYDNRSMAILFIGQDSSPYTDDAHAVDSITVKNCYLSNPEGDAFADQTDLIHTSSATHWTVDNNVFHMKRPDYSVSNHCDGIQSIRTEGWKITNNFFIDDSATYTQANILSFWNDTEDGRMDSVIWYNNVFYEGGTWQHPSGTGQGTCLFLRNEGMISGTENAVVVLINNTIVTYGPNYAAINVQSERVIDYFKNNIVAQFGNGNNGEQQTNYLGFYGAPSPDITYFDNYAGNLYYREWGTESWRTGSGYFSGCGYTSPSGYDIVGVSELNNTFCANDMSGDPSFEHDFSYGNHLQASLSNYTMDDWRAGILPQFWMPQNGSIAVDGGEDLQSVVEAMGLEWKDILGNPRDSSPTIGAYQTENGPDLTPPSVTGATLLDSVTLVVNFSESLDQTTAEDENNYSITNNIDVFNASLSGSKVTLQTSAHSPDLYTVTVVNVEDLAGNPIAQNNTAEYEYIVIPPDSLVMLPVQNVEGIIIEPDHTPEKTIDGMGAFDGDPDSRWAAEPMPEELIFDLGSAKTVCKTRLSFYNWNNGRVYNYSVAISNDHNNWTTVIPQATSALQEEWTIDEFPAVDARYIQVHFINSNQSNWAGLWEGEIWGIGGGGGENNPPFPPSNPNPSNGTTNQSTEVTLAWNCSDPDGDPLIYDIYFGTNDEPPLVLTDQSNTSFNPGTLTSNTTYFWRIIAKDNHGASTSGLIWNFTTVNVDVTPPEIANTELLDSVTLKIWFTEPLEQSSAQNINNYSINNGIQVLSASLSGIEVTLSTTEHSSGTYTLTVINLKDLAGNQITPPNNTDQYEYTPNPAEAVNLELKVFLDGPYTDNTMNTELENNSLIPLTHPYSVSPWNYYGSETVTGIPQNAVDWILLELRTNTSASSMVSRRAAFIRNDGMVVDLNGENYITFSGIQSGDYYVVVYHRNHLAIMSKNAIPLSDSSSIYDFTISQEKAYGNEPMKPLGNGKYGLYSADGNSNGGVNGADNGSVWKPENGSTGYKYGDFDLNGGVNIADKNKKWKQSKGKNSFVPTN